MADTARQVFKQLISEDSCCHKTSFSGFSELGFTRYSAVMAGLWILLASVGVSLSGAVLLWRHGSRRMGTAAQPATDETLHTASLAVSALRGGLTQFGGQGGPGVRRLPAPGALVMHEDRIRTVEPR
jgi:hypothetical protein